jgi:hypothetical protein
MLLLYSIVSLLLTFRFLFFKYLCSVFSNLWPFLCSSFHNEYLLYHALEWLGISFVPMIVGICIFLSWSSLIWDSIYVVLFAVFEPYKDSKVDLLVPKLVFIALNLGGLALGIWKVTCIFLVSLTWIALQERKRKKKIWSKDIQRFVSCSISFILAA